MNGPSNSTTDTLRVDLGERAYDILVGQGLVSAPASFAGAITGRDVLVVSNETVAPLYGEALRAGLADYRVSEHLLPDGEQYKSPEQALGIIDTALAAGAGRDLTIVALGGGVVGDMAGFAAACFMRGIRFVQVPTTLLAQVDSSVGGKTGVNHPAGKNLIGAFHQPVRVVIDTDTLKTLPPREYAAGLAEVIKYGAITDLEFLGWLEQNMDSLRHGDTEALRHAIVRSCALKAAVVSEDEREAGRRAILNFGHTFGHAIEACTGFGPWLHGEAVGAGMRMAARMSDIDTESRGRLDAVIDAAGLPKPPDDIAADDLLAAMGHDKKVQAGKIRLVLLKRLGDACLTDDYDPDRLYAVLAGRG